MPPTSLLRIPSLSLLNSKDDSDSVSWNHTFESAWQPFDRARTVQQTIWIYSYMSNTWCTHSSWEMPLPYELASKWAITHGVRFRKWVRKTNQKISHRAVTCTRSCPQLWSLQLSSDQHADGNIAQLRHLHCKPIPPGRYLQSHCAHNLRYCV